MYLSPDHPPIPLPRRKVLVVDDEPTLRLGFSYALADHETDTAATGREALLKLDGGDFDLVLLDLRMPDIDGLGVIEALRRCGNPVPVVLCSAAITPAAALRAITGNVVDFLLKPVRPADLRGVVAYVLSPSDDPLSKALGEARLGRFDEAVFHLETETDPPERTSAWLAILRALRSGGLEAEAAVFSKLEKGGLSILAYRAEGP